MMLYNALTMGKKTLKIAPSSLDCVTSPEDRAAAIGKMYKKFGKDRVCGSGDMFADRHTETCSLQHFTIAPASNAGQRNDDFLLQAS